MNGELVKTFRFDAAHWLPNAPPGHKCARPHGHGYRVDVHVIGPVDPHAGWVMDFGRIKGCVQPLIDRLDHSHLNEVEDLANPTSELLAHWLWERIHPDLPELSAVVVHESDGAKCIYRGD